MPKMYEAIRDKAVAEGMDYDDAQAKAARIYNSKHPDAPVGRSHVSSRDRWEKGEISHKDYIRGRRARGKLK